MLPEDEISFCYLHVRYFRSVTESLHKDSVEASKPLGQEGSSPRTTVATESNTRPAKHLPCLVTGS